MKEIIYMPVYIDGKEENLPKEEGYYFISTGDKYDINYDVFHFTKVNARQNKLDWMEHVVFWLKPIKIEAVIEERMPTLEEAQNTAYNRCMGLQVNSHGEASPKPDRFTYMIFIEGTEWFRSRMKGTDK